MQRYAHSHAGALRRIAAERSAPKRRVDHARRGLYFPALATALCTLVGGCAAAGSGPAGVPDAAAEQRLESATAPAGRTQIVFDWSMTDRDARFSGRGVVRVEGYRARLDLFGPRGETLAAAVVDGDAMRVVPDAAAAMLPPSAMLWSSLGVFRRPADAPLTGTQATDDGVSLRYASGGTQWRFDFAGERLQSAEWTEGSGRRTVVLSGSAAHGFPEQAVFRDWTEFRELTLRVTEVEERAAFEPDVWILPGER